VAILMKRYINAKCSDVYSRPTWCNIFFINTQCHKTLLSVTSICELTVSHQVRNLSEGASCNSELMNLIVATPCIGASDPMIL